MQSIIKNKIIDFNKIKLASVQRCPVYLCVPCLGGVSDRFAKQISQAVQKYYFSANVHVFSKKPILTSIRKGIFIIIVLLFIYLFIQM